MKKYPIVLLLFFCCILYTHAQQASNLYQRKIDSLQSLIDHQPRVDTTTVKRLNFLAQFCFFDMQFKRGMLATVEARQLARKLNFAKGEGMYYRTLCYFNINSALYFNYNYEAKWAYSDRKQMEQNPLLGTKIPNNLYNQRAKEELEDAIGYFEKHPDWEIQANLFFTYSHLLKSDAQALYLEKALKLFTENNRPALALLMKADKMRKLKMSNKLKEAKAIELEIQMILAHTKNDRNAAITKYYMAGAGGGEINFELLYRLEKQLEKMDEKEMRLNVLHVLGTYCFDLGLNKKGVEYFKKEIALAELNLNNSAARLTTIYLNIAFSYIRLKEFDEAMKYIEKSRNAPVAQQTENERIVNTGRYYDAMGQLLMGQEKYDEALKNFAHSLTIVSRANEAPWLSAYMELYSAQCYQKLGKVEEGIKMAEKSYNRMKNYNIADMVERTSLVLSELYEKAEQPLEAYKYLKIYKAQKKEAEQKQEANQILNAEIRTTLEKGEEDKQLQSQRIQAIEKQREIDALKAEAEKNLLKTKAEQEKKLEKERLEAKALVTKREQDYKISLLNLDIDSQRKIRTGLLGGLGVFALLLAVLFQQNRAKQRFNQTLAKQKEQIEQQRDQLDKTVTDLKSTQAQLIQKEKLASLGELTAGIAHEIQNPLNFVNNFSELSVDLAKEIQEERAKGMEQRDEELIDDLVADLADNQSKINHHGKRASSIVKGMLEHSRTSSGKKELTDINALTDEYLRLAYHGLRAKDKNFNSDFKTTLEPNLPKLEIQPQDMGRVLLNLINNAFYAVSKAHGAEGKGIVEVSTRKLADAIEIRVKDNGTGMPEAVMAKVFQPFFTTKPTGEGTGLGLSLAYDIVTKGHDGTLEVESVEGEGTEFVVRLPISDKTI